MVECNSKSRRLTVRPTCRAGICVLQSGSVIVIQYYLVE